MEYNDNLYSSRMTRINYNKIINIIKQKDHQNNLRKNVYRPINPIHPFNLKIISPDEISKKENALLINNNTLKDIILKFNDERRKKSIELIKNHQYFYNKFKDEDKRYDLALKTILKKDFNNLPNFLSDKKVKKKKINLKIKNSRNNNNFIDNLSYNNKSLGFLTTSSHIKTLKTEVGNYGNLTHRVFQTSEHNGKSKNFLINKYKCPSLDLKVKLIKKTSANKELKYRNKIKLKNINNLNIKKQLNFSVTNMNSAKLGKMSIFGVFEDNGIYGKMISSIIINYLIDYFEKSKEMVVSLEKNNFYSILHWSFVNAQQYLINNARKFNIDIYNSGCSACILLVPNNKGNVFYCANAGKCKCILYTNRGTDKLSFLSHIDRASERDRIIKFIQNKKKKKLKKIEKNKNEKENEKNTKEKNDNKRTLSVKINNDKIGKQNKKDNNDNSIKKEENNKNEEERIINAEKYIKYFKELGITRCFGNISGADMGLVPDPEVTECDLRSNKVKYAVLGNTIFWRILDEKEVRFIVSKYMDNNDTAGATKELEELIKQKVGVSSKILFDYSFVVVYFDTII